MDIHSRILYIHVTFTCTRTLNHLQRPVSLLYIQFFLILFFYNSLSHFLFVNINYLILLSFNIFFINFIFYSNGTTKLCYIKRLLNWIEANIIYLHVSFFFIFCISIMRTLRFGTHTPEDEEYVLYYIIYFFFVPHCLAAASSHKHVSRNYFTKKTGVSSTTFENYIFPLYEEKFSIFRFFFF